MKEFENISRDILKWSYTKSAFLNVISPPYNNCEIFLSVIINYISHNKKVLYVTEEKNNINICKKLKELKIKNYSHIKSADNKADTLIQICNLDVYENINDIYDLVIIDDIIEYTDISLEYLRNVILKKDNGNTKYIIYSPESIFKEEKEIIIPIRNNFLPLVEPRIINTRINLNKEIPCMVYDYILYSLSSSRNVIIFVPDSEKVINVYRYISILFKRKNINVSYYVKNKTEDKVFLNYLKVKKNSIMVTDDFNKENIISDNTNIMVLFCDDDFFTYKKLIFLCGKVGRNGHGIGEAIFISGSTTCDMEKASERARYFNKEAWEMGFLKY